MTLLNQVEDDVVTCETVTEAVCEDEVSGYTARPRCSSVPRQQCSLAKQRVQKVTPETSCDKQPVEVCAPRGCGFVNVRCGTQDSSLDIVNIFTNYFPSPGSRDLH